MAAIVVALGWPLVVSGCAQQRAQPAEFFQLTPESSANRAMQTRVFETPTDHELLSASAAALQRQPFFVNRT